MKIFLKKIENFLGIKLTALIIKWYPDYFNAKVAELSSKVSQKVVIDYLKEEGILHCALCLKRRTLHNYGNLYYCDNHFSKIQKEPVPGGVK